MRKPVFVAILTFIMFSFQPLSAAEASDKEKKIVSEAIEAIELCYHWAGEAGEGDEDRQKQIAQGFDRDCPVATRKARAAFHKYPNNSELAYQIFSLIEINYFDYDFETKEALCKSALPYYKTLGYEDDTYVELCPNQVKPRKSR